MLTGSSYNNGVRSLDRRGRELWPTAGGSEPLLDSQAVPGEAQVALRNDLTLLRDVENSRTLPPRRSQAPPV